MRNIRNEVAPYHLELAYSREIEEREYRAAACQRTRRQRERVPAHGKLKRLSGRAVERCLNRVLQLPHPRQTVDAERDVISDPEKRSTRRIDTQDLLSLANRHHTFIQ